LQAGGLSITMTGLAHMTASDFSQQLGFLVEVACGVASARLENIEKQGF
jgi:hypothetical protein